MPYRSQSHPKTCVSKVKAVLVLAVVIKNGKPARLGLPRPSLSHYLWTTPKELSVAKHTQNASLYPYQVMTYSLRTILSANRRRQYDKNSFGYGSSC